MPLALSGFGGRMMGIDELGNTARWYRGHPDTVGRLARWAATSAPRPPCSGGRGNFVNFYETGDELFAVMCEMEKKLKVRSFFTLTKTFWHHKKRALRLLELMEANNKSWAIYVFSSARVLQSYTIDQLVRLGVSWVWMGLEGNESAYDKLRGWTRTPGRTSAIPRKSVSLVRRSSDSKATARKTWMPSSIFAVKPRDRFPSVHALHPHSGNGPV